MNKYRNIIFHTTSILIDITEVFFNTCIKPYLNLKILPKMNILPQKVNTTRIY
ncbi:hypothetical protein BXY64_1388 [Marinifilum flexuosum]|uniref:Uncharacterized protein n=1 Tax=Marinifilum flexuosum TaxID=1117708 RepID=A0A419X9C6_9BACT|nr:hypothetical protein BXY64_1388 [Marinifilum flexuosum]